MRERCMEHRSNFGGGWQLRVSEGTLGDVYSENIRSFVHDSRNTQVASDTSIIFSNEHGRQTHIRSAFDLRKESQHCPESRSAVWSSLSPYDSTP